MKVRLAILIAIIVAGLTVIVPATAQPAAAGNWSTGMFTVNRCSWAGQQHCRWVATELPFYPEARCSRITFKGQTMSGLALTMDVSSGKPGHRTYGWGVPTSFALFNGDWQNSGNWRYYNTCR